MPCKNLQALWDVTVIICLPMYISTDSIGYLFLLVYLLYAVLFIFVLYILHLFHDCKYESYSYTHIHPPTHAHACAFIMMWMGFLRHMA